MARDSANAHSFQERSATLRLAVSALPAFRGSVPRQVLRARQYSLINIRRPNSQPILSNNVPFPFTCHASLGTQVMSVHLLAQVMVDYFTGTHTHANTHASSMQLPEDYLAVVSFCLAW